MPIMILSTGHIIANQVDKSPSFHGAHILTEKIQLFQIIINAMNKIKQG